jgi:hypothetical protein
VAGGALWARLRASGLTDRERRGNQGGDMDSRRSAGPGRTRPRRIEPTPAEHLIESVDVRPNAIPILLLLLLPRSGRALEAERKLRMLRHQEGRLFRRQPSPPRAPLRLSRWFALRRALGRRRHGHDRTAAAGGRFHARAGGVPPGLWLRAWQRCQCGRYTRRRALWCRGRRAHPLAIMPGVAARRLPLSCARVSSRPVNVCALQCRPRPATHRRPASGKEWRWGPRAIPPQRRGPGREDAPSGRAPPRR